MARPSQTFPASLDALPRVLACVDGCLENVDDDTLMRARIAVEELFINFVSHGSTQGESLQAWLEVQCDSGRLNVSFEDSAAPFDIFANLEQVSEALDQPLELRSTGGVGRLLIMQLADSARYSRRSGCNRIELMFSPRTQMEKSTAL